jgi:hypothetical protein
VFPYQLNNKCIFIVLEDIFDGSNWSKKEGIKKIEVKKTNTYFISEVSILWLTKQDNIENVTYNLFLSFTNSWIK